MRAGRLAFAVASVILVSLVSPADAQKGHAGGHSSHTTAHVPRAPRVVHAPSYRTPRSITTHLPRVRAPRPAPIPGARDSRGRLERSVKAKDDFMRSTGHPHGWPGHVVDHVVPLSCGGADAPSNMQWQTSAEAKAKDKVERKGCGR